MASSSWILLHRSVLVRARGFSSLSLVPSSLFLKGSSFLFGWRASTTSHPDMTSYCRPVDALPWFDHEMALDELLGDSGSASHREGHPDGVEKVEMHFWGELAADRICVVGVLEHEIEETAQRPDVRTPGLVGVIGAELNANHFRGGVDGCATVTVVVDGSAGVDLEKMKKEEKEVREKE